MARKTVITSLILLLLAVTLSGQVLNLELQNFYDEHKMLKSLQPVNFSYDGSPYLSDQFRNGDIILENGTVFKDIPLRYNAYYDLFEYTIKGNEYALDKSKKYSQFRIDEQTFIYKSYLFNSTEKEGYLEIVSKGNYSLYRIYKVVLKEAEEEGAYKEATRARFVHQKPDYLIGKGDDKIFSIRNKKELLKSFNKLTEPLKKYSGDKKIKLKNEEDYLQLVEFLNSL